MTAAPTMELTWWPVAIAGVACLVICVGLAVLLPTARGVRRLRPLANVDRLTRLPEYARAARLRSASAMATIAMLLVLFGAAVVAAARPVDVRTAEADQPEDVMLCVGQPATDPDTATFLSYFARQTTTEPKGQRIGLTSSSRRVVPLTRDYQYAAGRFGDYAGLAALQADVDADRPLPPAQVSALRTRADSFAPPVPYVDYARSVEDVLALCLTGFPSSDPPSDRRRSLIYLGPSMIRAPGETRPALFTAEQVQALADRNGVQMNLVTVVDPTASSRAADAALGALAEHTGGQFFRQLPAGTGGGADQLIARLDAIRADPPPAVRAGGDALRRRPGESPVVPLAVALVAAAFLSVSLVVLRR